MKILLISPAWPEKAEKQTKALFPPLGLAMVAALTPEDKDIKITILDEHIEVLDFEREADLVGITVMTATAPRAYEIADAFRKKGSMVVMGGIHVSALPEEAIQHADSVVIGEAEGAWPKLISDFKKGKMERFYQSPRRPDLGGLPLPRRELVASDSYLIRNTVQTTRGCPFNCAFCSVTNFFGNTYRFRPVDDIIRELDTLRGNVVAFVDDNIIGHVRYARDLFKALIGRNLKWISQGSLSFAKDPELLELAARSGCIGMFVGFESLSAENLREMGKSVNIVHDFKESIRRIRSYGIGIEGAFVFGFDDDDEGVFERTVKFARECKLEAAQFGILTPFPGTPLYERMSREDRIFEKDWAKYTINRVVFQPKRMSVETLQRGFNWAWKEFYSIPSIFGRIGLLRRYSPFLWNINMQFRSRALRFVRSLSQPTLRPKVTMS